MKAYVCHGPDQRGDCPEVDHGRILGHEAVGTITEVGSATPRLRHRLR